MSNNDNRAPRRNISQQSTGSQSRNDGGRAHAFSSALNPVSRTSSIRSRLGPQHSADIAEEYSIYDTPFEDPDFGDRNPFREVSRMAAQASQNPENTMQARQTTEEGRNAAIHAWRNHNEGQRPNQQLSGASGAAYDEERARIDALQRTYLANQRRREEKRTSDQTLTDYKSQLQNQTFTADTYKRNSRMSDLDPMPRRPRARSMDSFTYDKLTRGENHHFPVPVAAGYYNGYGGRDLEREGSRARDNGRDRRGILGQLKESFKNLTYDQELGLTSNSRAVSREPSQNHSRRNSWSGPQSTKRDARESMPDPFEGMNNFERSQAINFDAEETYLIDENDHERLRHRLQRRYNEHKMDKHLDHEERKDRGHQRKSYSERRKKEKHVIKYHAECAFKTYCTPDVEC